jgi:hypothetical protein
MPRLKSQKYMIRNDVMVDEVEYMIKILRVNSGRYP